MAIKARLGAGEWDMLVCENCEHLWHGLDVDPTWTDDPEGEHGASECPSCGGTSVVREERG